VGGQHRLRAFNDHRQFCLKRGIALLLVIMGFIILIFGKALDIRDLILDLLLARFWPRMPKAPALVRRGFMECRFRWLRE